jgi:nucleotide-binding universal stress UspA family protein
MHPVVIGIKEHQPTALQFAADAALAREADLYVVHSVEPVIAGDVVLPVDEGSQAAGQQLLDQAKAFIDALDPAPHAEYTFASGPPVAVLERAAAAASMVVVGTDEPDWAARFFTDKVTERLAKHVDVPVAIVPEWSRTHHVGQGVYVALDGRSPAPGPLRFAFTEANRQRRKKLRVLHAPSARASFDGMNEVRAEMSEILAGWGEEFPDVDVTRRLVFDETDEGCLNASKDADLLVIGRADNAGMIGIFGHPILTQIARRTQCPSVVVPNDWKET